MWKAPSSGSTDKRRYKEIFFFASLSLSLDIDFIYSVAADLLLLSSFSYHRN